MISALLSEKPEIITGYHEYRRATYLLLYQGVKKEGLISYLSDPRSLQEISQEFGFIAERERTLLAVLGVLMALGIIRPDGSNGTPRFVADGDNDMEPEAVSKPLDLDLLRRAIGAERAESVAYAQQIPEAIQYLRGERDGNQFDAGQLSRWQSLLEFPYWEFGRRACGQAIARPGAQVADLACGLGHGVRELAGLVGPDGSVQGVELSADFVRLASEGLPANATIRQGDLNDGLSFLADESLDGAMISGAFHFVRDKTTFLRDLYRAMTPGGKVALGNVVRQTTAFDQAAHDITCSMLTPPVLMSTPDELHSFISASGFKLVDIFDEFGCVGWYEMVRP